MMFDTHAHVHFNAYKDDMDKVINRSREKGTIMNLVGTLYETSKKGVEVAERYEGCYASIGLHPEHLFSSYHDTAESDSANKERDFNYEAYKELTQSEKVIGVGECGLDLYRIPEGMTIDQVLPKQEEVFRKHIQLAQETDLPMVIHCREAHQYLTTILSDVGSNTKPVRGTIHCYTSNWHYAEQYLAMGLYIGFTGVITFPPQKKNPQAQEDLLEVVRRMPEDRILLETDCPYLSPIPYRGQRGEPWMVEATAEKMAELRGVSKEHILKVTTENALRLFNRIK